MQWAKYMVSTGCQGSAVVTMQGEGNLRGGTRHSVRAVSCPCHSRTQPPHSCTGIVLGTPQEPPSCARTPPPYCTGIPPFLHRNPPPFLHRNRPRNPPGNPLPAQETPPFQHRNPPPFVHKNPPSWTATYTLLGPFLHKKPHPFPAQEPPSWTTSCPLSSLAFCVPLFRLTST